MKSLPVACVALLFAACGLPEQQGAEPPRQPDTVRIHWSVFDEASKTRIVKYEDISQAQARALLATRRAHAAERAAARRGSQSPVTIARQALTVGSGSWQDCQWWDWYLMTSGQNGTGDIFCAKHQAEGGTNNVMIPFTPLYREDSDTYWALLCSSDDCYLKAWDCGLDMRGRWEFLSQPGTNTGNLNLLPETRWISMSVLSPC